MRFFFFVGGGGGAGRGVFLKGTPRGKPMLFFLGGVTEKDKDTHLCVCVSVFLEGRLFTLEGKTNGRLNKSLGQISMHWPIWVRHRPGNLSSPLMSYSEMPNFRYVTCKLALGQNQWYNGTILGIFEPILAGIGMFTGGRVRFGF